MELRVTARNISILKEKLKNTKFKGLEDDFKKVCIWGRDDAVKSFRVEAAVSVEFLDYLIEELEELDDFEAIRWTQMQKSVLESGNDKKIKSTKAFVTLMTKYITENIIDGWLYKYSEHGYLPYLVKSIVKVSSDPSRGQRAGVQIEFVFASPKGNRVVDDMTVFISIEQMRDRTLIEILTDIGFIRETEELKADYVNTMKKYGEFQRMFGCQFLLNGRTESLDRYCTKKAKTSRNVKVINNEPEPTKHVPEKVAIPLFRGAISSFDDSRLSDYIEQEYEFEDGEEEDIKDDVLDKTENKCRDEYSVQMMTLPYHPLIKIFNLEEHSEQWVSASAMSVYDYDKTLEKKLVLPDEHRDLIDVLVKDSDIILEDIVLGKSGGTVVLCKGLPGLGKTLTAEVYSETVEKPLYRVHSGQLGTNPDEMDKKLKKIIERSESWNAILLIDESDVFIRKRQDDITQNAIVASFLRQLEAMNGIVFLTTNRVDDVDDAILSRCSAIVTYEHPKSVDALKIWSILQEHYEINMSDELIKKAHNMYPNASGRDIKEIMKLCYRFQRKDYTIDEERLRICGMFRGMTVSDGNQ